jgi:phenylacetate-CoA ligase
MTKSEMMGALDDVFTDRRLNRGLVEEALSATGAEPICILGGYVALASGGSSGERGVFVFDRAAIAGFFSALSLMARLRALGGPPPDGLPIALVAAASAVHATGAAPALSAGPDMPFRFIPVPATLPSPEIVAQLNALQPRRCSATPRCWVDSQPSSKPVACTSLRWSCPRPVRRS